MQGNVRHQQNLYVAIQKSAKNWRVLMANDRGDTKPCHAAAGDLKTLLGYIDDADSELGLRGNLYSCYLSSQEGFWLHRALVSQMIQNTVIEMNSLPSKPTLQQQVDLLRVHIGAPEAQPFRVVKVPSLDEEIVKHVGRERKRLRSEINSHTTRMQSLLAMQGLIDIDPIDCRPDKLRDWDGKKLHPVIQDELKREQKRYELVKAQFEAVQELYDKQRPPQPVKAPPKL
ncbi:MAG TPA: hypothetical protein DCZ95_11870 [Verrucomicrobia bacterium]|nr:MAG: hypothetical protein A2X46_13915 [Lentisphaerae bacterium GWF2_57_35]HBA84782.1 hypothetical protein [Verrucomicrobiota bacterium]